MDWDNEQICHWLTAWGKMKLNNAKTFVTNTVTIHCSDLMSTLSNLNVVKCIVFNKMFNL